MNRRQLDPADQEALGLLRRGEAVASQQLRTDHGWEHELATPGETRRTMADAVCTDIGRYGAERVAALVVSHPDAEDVADRSAPASPLLAPSPARLWSARGGRPRHTRPGTGCSSTPAAAPRAARPSTEPPARSPPSKKLGS